MYGAYYTPQTISNIALVLTDQVEIIHKRPMSLRLVCVYLDATYLTLRQDTVSKEALHVIVEINEEGLKEVLNYRLYPTESSENSKEMLLDLKGRGLSEVLLFVSEGLIGLRDACLEKYPNAKHQSCWAHISRRIGHLVRAKDNSIVLGDLKEVYQSETKETALSQIEIFKDKCRSHYPKAIRVLDDNPTLTSFYDFPQPIQRSLYTTNPIECLNNQLKRQTKKIEQFPMKPYSSA